MISNAIEALETKLAFLERASAELGDEVYRQRKEIDELRARFAALSSRMDSSAATGVDAATAEERPPHY